MPKHLRKHVAVVYQFARQADDIADEAGVSEESRVKSLNEYEISLENCLARKYENEFWEALNHTINEYNLTSRYFFDLLSAFRQDLVKKRYSTFDDVIDYCRRSANPVGRIILEFFDIRDEKSMLYSDSICTALQLTNFYQDISVDFQKGRIYIPIDEMEKFGVPENQFELRKNNTNFEQLVGYQVDRTKRLFEVGSKLLDSLPKGLKRQIRMTMLGGGAILRKIEKLNYDLLNQRPSLSKSDFIKIFLKSFL